MSSDATGGSLASAYSLRGDRTESFGDVGDVESPTLPHESGSSRRSPVLPGPAAFEKAQDTADPRVTQLRLQWTACYAALATLSGMTIFGMSASVDALVCIARRGQEMAQLAIQRGKAGLHCRGFAARPNCSMLTSRS